MTKSLIGNIAFLLIKMIRNVAVSLRTFDKNDLLYL